MSLAGKQRMKLGQIKMMMSIIQSKVNFFFCIRATKVDKKFLENRMNQEVRKYVTLKIENRPFFLKRICEFWDQPTSKSDSSIQIDENISQKECRLWPNRIFFQQRKSFLRPGTTSVFGRCLSFFPDFGRKFNLTNCCSCKKASSRLWSISAVWEKVFLKRRFRNF